MARYLSPAWLEAVDRAVQADGALRDATAGVHLVVQHVVRGGAGPEGDVCFHVAIDDGSVRVRPGPASSPSVTLTEDRSTAVAVARGERSAQEAFMDGEVRVGGDIGELLAAQAALARLGDVFASVRADTDFGA
jgi:hypothetical protein